MNIFERFFNKKSSGSTAKNRLQLMLVSDRTNCSPELMENIRKDIMDVLAKYVEIDTDKLEINIEQSDMDNGQGKVPVLFANIPIKSMKTHQ